MNYFFIVILKNINDFQILPALPLINEHKQSESDVETWPTEQNTKSLHYKYTAKVPEPLVSMCLDVEQTELKTLDNLTEKAILEPLNTELTYEVLSVCAPKEEQGKDEFEIESEASDRSGLSALDGSKLNENLNCKIPAYKYVAKLPETFLYGDGEECFKELENTGNRTNKQLEPEVINYEVQSSHLNDYQKQIVIQTIKGELATKTSVVPGESKTKRHYKCMIPAYEDATKLPEPFLYINGPECFPELINKEVELIEPGVINHQVQSVCAPCKEVIDLENKMRTIKGVDRMAVLSALREQPKRKDYKCMISAYEDAIKVPEPFLYINGPEFFQELENKETVTDKQIGSGANTDETTVCAAEIQQPDIKILKNKGTISAEESEPSISEHDVKDYKRKRSKCIHEIQSVCNPSREESNLEFKLSKIKGNTRICQEEHKPKKDLKCMISAYEHTSKIPEPFLYINGPDDEESPNLERNNKKETVPGKITYEVLSVCATPDKNKTKIRQPLSVMWKRFKRNQDNEN